MCSTTIPLHRRRSAYRFRTVVVIPSTSASPRDASRTDVSALVIDRLPLFVDAIASLLQGPQIHAAVMTANGTDSGLELIRTRGFDIVLCEVGAKPLSGSELIETLASEGIAVPVILLGDEGDEAQLAVGLATKAAGLFTKNASVDEFLDGVSAVLAGHRAIGSALLSRLLDRLAQPPLEDPRLASRQLSPTELEILAMIGQAQSIGTIAARRGISHKTVRNHLAKIYRKLDLHGRTEAVLWAARMGLTEA